MKRLRETYLDGPEKKSPLPTSHDLIRLDCPRPSFYALHFLATLLILANVLSMVNLCDKSVAQLNCGTKWFQTVKINQLRPASTRRDPYKMKLPSCNKLLYKSSRIRISLAWARRLTYSQTNFTNHAMHWLWSHIKDHWVDVIANSMGQNPPWPFLGKNQTTGTAAFLQNDKYV